MYESNPLLLPFSSSFVFLLGHSNKWTAVLDCAPLHVPITAMLGPYGHGTYTAMQYWQANHVSGAGTRFSARELSAAGIDSADCSLV